MRTFSTTALLGLGLLTACPAAEDKGNTTATSTSPKQATAPASQPASAPHGKIEGGPPAEPVAGLVKLADDVDASAVKPTDVLFIMARESQGGGKAGRLVAVQRFGQVKFPKRFELSSKDAMVPGVPFKGPFVIYARLDKDGDPMTKGADDLYGAVSSEVPSGAEDAHIVLKKRAPAPNTPASAPAK